MSGVLPVLHISAVHRDNLTCTLLGENRLTGCSQLERIQYSITYEATHSKVKDCSNTAQTQDTHVKVINEFTEVNSFQN